MVFFFFNMTYYFGFLPAGNYACSLDSVTASSLFCIFYVDINANVPFFSSKAWFKRRILHAPITILIRVDSN